MAKVVWLPGAYDDLVRLVSFLHAKNPDAAARAAGTIRARVATLETSSAIGRPMTDETGRRELIIPFGGGAYVVRYKVHPDGSIVIIRAWHSRELRI